MKNVNPVDCNHRKRIAIVLSNPAISTTTGWRVGSWWSELSHRYYVFDEAGFGVELFSPNGGQCEADVMSDPRDRSGYSANGLISLGFIAKPRLIRLVENTRPVAALAVDELAAIVVAGEQGPMFTFEQAAGLHAKFAKFYEPGKVACALCHGVAVLRFARLSNSEHLARGKTITGFANVEEDFADDAVWSMNLLPTDKHVMPWRIEDEMRRVGADYVQAGLWRSFAIRDGNLITGQQDFSDAETAQAVVAALGR